MIRARGALSTEAMLLRPVLLLALLVLVLSACDRTPSRSGVGDASPSPVATAGPSPSSSSSPSSSPSSSEASSALTDRSFVDLVERLSEPDRRFFSDNHVSNETSYLHVAGGLARHAGQGGAYLGVGPEQNFSYIAMLGPRLAFIVDIRRENMILHLLYRAIFRRATSRSHFLALLLGRPHDAASDPGEGASIEDVIKHACKLPADAKAFAAIHLELVRRVQEAFALDAGDRKSLDAAHRAFFKGQLDLRFELLQKNGRAYPPLRDLLAATDLAGNKAGFLASEGAFRLVQAMQRENRIVPLVGDFAGERALPGVAALLRERGLTLSAFYVSNVEQYLFEGGAWARWVKNVEALPTDDRSLFIRAYLDQGKRHPRQQEGHRTATLLQRMTDFRARHASKPYTTWWDVSTDQGLD